jgi:signal transduction histidine kinase/ActR/RegA family two-component response regulator
MPSKMFSIRSRLMWLAIVSVLPVTILAVALTALFWWHQRQAFDQRFLERVRAMSIALDTEINSSLRLLSWIASAPEVDARHREEFARRMRQRLPGQPTWSSIMLADPTGKLLVRVDNENQSVASGHVHVDGVRRAVATREPALSGILPVGGGQFTTQVAMPVMRGDVVAAVLITHIEPRVWLHLLTKYPVAANATLTLVDQNGLIVARTLNNERYVGQQPSPAFLHRIRGRAEDAYLSVGLEGQHFYTAHTRVGRWGWTLGSGVPVDDIEGSLLRSSVLMGGGALAAIAVAFLLALLFGRQIGAPITGLAQAARSLAQKGPLPPIHTGGITEVARVAQAFDEAHSLLERRERDLDQSLQREKRQREEAEANNRAKDEFLAMLGHELRNPLHAIAGAAAVLERVSHAGQPAARASDIIGRQTRHLTGLVDDLLDVARVTTGKIILNRQPIDAAAAVGRAVDMLRDGGRLSAHRVEVQVEPVFVLADPTRLEQIMANLLENAVKYTPANGLISVRLRRRIAEDGVPEAVIEVADSGSGIAPELLPKIFELFTQGERTLDRAQGGLGLGLALVRRLAQLHGGSVTADSAGIGRGACFTVCLPAIDPAAAPAEPVAPDAAATSRRVLIVEDNPDGRETLRMLLALNGHSVLEAGDGLAGVEAALAERPDAVVVDIGLPGIDGYEVARRIRADARTRTMRLIAASGYGQPEDRQRALQAGFDAFLVKPVQPDDLERQLEASGAAVW